MKDGFVVLNVNNEELWDNLKHGQKRRKNARAKNKDNDTVGSICRGSKHYRSIEDNKSIGTDSN